MCETVHSHIYRAVAKADQRAVAIKVARESSAEVHAAAQQELAIIRQLEGLIVVRGIELDYVEDRPALVMELFPGVGIDQWLAGAAIDLDRFLRVAASIAGALAGVHGCGVIHRDLKPSNILVNPETLDVCIADFGVAASLDGAMSVQAAAMIGSLAYLSPEQTGRMNRRVDSRSDLYSLGVTFYEMVTGRLPFAHASALELVHAHFALTPRSPSEINGEIPAAVSAVIGRLLAKEPDDRYQSAEGVEADLRELMVQRAAGQPLGGFALGRQDRPRTFLLPTRLYGRTAELGLLDRCLAWARDGSVELLAVGGASGTGKTALFAEAQQRLALQRGHFIKGKFDRLARNVPFSAVSQALAALVDQLLGEADRELEAIRSELTGKLAGLGQVLIEIAPAIEKLIGPQSAVQPVGLPESQARIADVFWRFLGALATPEHPMVMVLDDVQWADSGSLGLLHALVEDAGHGRGVALVLLCAFRDNELTASHPLRQLLDRARDPDDAAEAREIGAGVYELTLGPLEVGHVTELLSDTLRLPRGRVAPLAEVVFRKTAGNAFFVHQFLKHAHRLGLLWLAADGWHWDAEAIETAGIPDDAADLVADKIRSQAADVQGVIVDASIIGDEFDLATLFAVTAATGPEARHAVHVLVEDGLIVRAGERYRFVHDKIREAALGLCDAERAARTHVAVGRYRMRTLSPSETGAQIFAVADHLNHGHALLSPVERIAVAAHNLRAGKQALAVGAVSTAKPYLAAGLALLDGADPWMSHFQLIFELTLEHAYATFFSGDVDAAVAAFHRLLARDLSLPNMTAVQLRLIGARVSTEDYEQICRDGLVALAAFGIRIGYPLSPVRRVLAMLAAMRKLGTEPERLLALPVSTDEVVRARGQLINALSFPLYVFDPKVAGVLSLHAAPRIIDDGIDASSPMQLMSYAVVLQAALSRPEQALRFAKVASELQQRFGAPQHTAALLFARYQAIEPWHVPYRESLEHFGIAIEKALDVGDYQTVVICHVCRLYCALTEGVHLTRVERMGKDAHDACLRAGLKSEIHVITSLREVIAQLRDQPDFEAPADWLAAPLLARIEPGIVTFHMVATAQILALLVRGAYDAAYALADQISPAIFREAPAVVFVWIAIVGLGVGAAIRMAGRRGERARHRKQLDGAIKKLRRWAVHNPVFFEHKALWLEAERERAHGRIAAATQLYLEAREAALAGEYPHLAAAIDLRRGDLAIQHKLPGEASSRLQASVQAYRAWGARAVVSHLELRHADHVLAPHALHVTRHDSRTIGDSLRVTASVGAEHLDVGALVSASQAIAQEVTLASVLERVMSSTMASAGATLGVLLLERDGALVVRLRQRAGGKLEHSATRFDEADDLPRSIVRYVHHSGETVVLGDAAGAGPYMADPWVRSAAAKSILCAPIVKQARRVGVLLLHNELVSNAFTDRHLMTLQMLATQAAISIDNAVLYEELSTLNRELEARVDDRTRALRDAQQQLLTSARKAGMADVAVEVLHNVRNALNGVTVSAQLVESQLADSKLRTFQRLVAAFEEHKDDLAEFLTRDERGSKVATMMAMLNTTLTGEHETMLRELMRLRSGIDDVGQVVRELEATAEDKGIAILETPQLVLGAAAAAVDEQCARDRIAISTDDQPPPGAKVDKHKGLDVLVGLLRNAVEALEVADAPHREIRISVRGGGDSVVFAISDNGVGIAREHLTRIFHGGFSTKPDRRGTTLHRLANLATAAGGSLTVVSDGPGRGATFTLVLPNRGLSSEPIRRVRPTNGAPGGT